MTFYTFLSHYYDDIFPVNKKAVSFIDSLVSSKEKLTFLDLAAGTGAEAVEFASKGHTITATDIDDKMVNKIQEKIVDPSMKMNALQMNMTDIDKHFSPKTFDVIYCIGNSFVHLETEEIMTQVLKKCHDILKPNGKFILQIVNYDKIIKENVTKLPLIYNKEKDIKFERYYTNENDRIIFSINVQHNGKSYEQQTTLFPLRHKQFINMIERSPFSEYKTYGNFLMEPYTIDSPALVMSLTK